MNSSDFYQSFDDWVNQALLRLSDSAGAVFDFIEAVLNGFNDAILWAFNLLPFYGVALVAAVLGWRLVNWRFGLIAAAALVLCETMGLWADTMSTLSLVLAATVLALLVAIPTGILIGYVAALDRIAQPGLNMLQTFPPYIYLLPAIALLGYGPATALAATFIVALAPAIRLTALGIRITPSEFIELGRASGIKPWQMFFKIRLPFAVPSIMAGVNQSLMMAFGMVVIAGIVGSGGLGQTIYIAIRRLEIAESIDAGIAIVVLAIILDRLSQSASHGASESRS